jgi:anti-anti-sigma factor
MKAFSFDTREITGDNGCTVFELRGYIDAHTVIEFEKAVNAFMDNGGRAVILEISGLSYISSAGIGAMMGVARKLDKLGGSLVLLNPTEKVFSILHNLGFTKIFKIARDEAEALDILKANSP